MAHIANTSLAIAAAISNHTVPVGRSTIAALDRQSYIDDHIFLEGLAETHKTGLILPIIQEYATEHLPLACSQHSADLGPRLLQYLINTADADSTEAVQKFTNTFIALYSVAVKFMDPTNEEHRPKAYLRHLGFMLIFKSTALSGNQQAALLDDAIACFTLLSHSSIQVTEADGEVSADQKIEYSQLLKLTMVRDGNTELEKGYLSSLNEVLESLVQDVDRTAGDTEETSKLLHEIVNVLLFRYSFRQEDTDLDKSFEFAAKATKFNQDSATARHDLASVLHLRHRRNRKYEDLERAEYEVKQALAHLHTNPILRTECLLLQGRLFRLEYEATRKSAHLGEAIGCLRDALKCTSLDDQHTAHLYSELGTTHTTQFEISGRKADIQEALACFQKALDHDAKFSQLSSTAFSLEVRSNLAGAYLSRYRYWKSKDDLLAAVSESEKSQSGIHRQGLTFAKRTINLASIYQEKAKYERDVLGSGKRAEQTLAKALKLLQVIQGRWNPEDIAYDRGLPPQLLCDLYGVMGNLYATEAGPSSLDNAIQCYEHAVKVDQVESFSIAWASHNLAELQRRKADKKHYNAALDSLQKASLRLPKDHSFQWTISFSRAKTLRGLARSMDTDDGYEMQSLELLKRIVDQDNIDPQRRIESACLAAESCMKLGSRVEAADTLFRRAINLLPQAILLQSTRAEQLRLIRHYDGILEDGVAVALEAGATAEDAVALLESGRAFTWDRLINGEAKLEELQLVDPEAADELDRLRRVLFRRSGEKGTSSPHGDGPVDSVWIRRHDASEAFEKLLERIRAIEGFEDFMKTPTQALNLRNLAEKSVLVFVNVSDFRSDALVITADAIDSVALPKLAYANLMQQHDRFKSLLADFYQRVWRERTEREFEDIMKWLWENAVKPILDHTQGRLGVTAGHRISVRWVWGKLTSLLPVHAAGDYVAARMGSTSSALCFHDMATCAYTPSLRALVQARERAALLEREAVSTVAGPALLVGMAKTSGLIRGRPLDDLNVEPELKGVMTIIEGHMAVDPPVINPNLAKVCQLLKRCSLAHLACHCVADPTDPTESQLVLADHETRPLHVRRITSGGVTAPSCRLLYLSACESGLTRDISLLEEGIHVAGAFAMAGVPRVVSTLWGVDDAVCAQMAAGFYQTLVAKIPLDFSLVEEAIHNGVAALRKEKTHPLLWGPFVVSGA
jgi:tetratricopeptide (TPR) repeat protein